VGDNILLNISCDFNRVPHKGGPKLCNDVKDLDGIGKVVWEFFSVVYDLDWDGLYMDDFKTLFRNKVKS